MWPNERWDHKHCDAQLSVKSDRWWRSETPPKTPRSVGFSSWRKERAAPARKCSNSPKSTAMGSATIASSGPPVPCRISDERLGSKPSPETFWKISKVWKISENMFEKLENVQMSTFEVSNYPYIPHFRSSFRSRKSANPTIFRRGYQKKYAVNEKTL